MKRKGNLYSNICDMSNLILADKKARKGKADQPGVKDFDKDRENNLATLQQSLIDKTFRTSPYKKFIIFEPKEREIFMLPYFPDRIVQHAVMNILEPIFVSVFTADTYSCIKKRGIHAASYAVRRALRDIPGTQYCLKFDIKKFYPSIDHDILKQLLRRKIKDNDLLWLLDEIIDSAPGVPIGNYLSQYFGNFYLAYLDHYIKERLQAPYYFRYADDMVLFAADKAFLHRMLFEIRQYLAHELKLTIKSNYQVFLTDSRGADFCGYKHFHGYELLRKTIKQNFARAVARGADAQTLASHMSWAMHCDSKNLVNKLMHEAV